MNFPRLVSALATTLLALALPARAVPTVSSRVPAPGATVSTLTQVSVTFSEVVTGVTADALTVNAESPYLVTGSGAGPYVFTFTQPPPGAVALDFASDHGIVGQLGTGSFSPPAAWSYTLTDTIAPTVAQLTPAAGATVANLTQVEVVFSEVVTGVDAADLTVNGVSATAVSGSGFGPYVFTVTPPAVGSVTLAWVAGHGIQDTAAAPNGFAGGTWNVTRSATGIGSLVINEFLASNGTGILDENGDQTDWIEIYNSGAGPVSLAGWALTDDHDNLPQWIFPAWTLNASQYLIVYASGKNRKPAQTSVGVDNANTLASPRLHANFTINENGGYLALVGPESPRMVVTQFPPNYDEAAGVTEFPSQRTDYSYGPQASDGALRYFATPTPKLANGNSAFTASTPKVNFSVQRGFFKESFQLVLTCTDATAPIRYTTTFTEPTSGTGLLYSGPITISATTCIRAVAFGSSKIPSLPVTNTFIYLDQLLSQNNTPVNFPNNWGTYAAFSGGVIPADYEMDTDPLRDNPLSPVSPVNAAKLQRFNSGLRELPLVSLVLPVADIFDSTGLYYGSTTAALNHVEDKAFPYKKCSVEMILPDGSTAFAVTCGLGGHGNASRTPSKNPKHGFQIKFKGDFGPGSLDYPIFTDSAVNHYDDIILRPDFGTSWRHWSDNTSNLLGNNQRSRASRTRDAFIKSTFHDMGWLASHHRFFHLYINGVYWGVYDFAEQPVEGFVSAYFGGDKADYSIIHEGIAKNGSDAVYTNMTSIASVTTNALYDQMKSYLDVTEYIDYVLMQFYVGAQDWGGTKNWYAFRRRATASNPTEGKYQYVPWDEENTLLDTTIDRVNFDPNKYGLPSGLHARTDSAGGLIGNLTNHPQYRLDFADRVHKHLIAPGGALTSAANVARWLKWQALLDKPIVAESCRWGDYRRDVHPYSDGPLDQVYNRETHWLKENTRITGLPNGTFPADPSAYFPGRAATLMSQLLPTGLYPNVLAPEYRHTDAMSVTTTVGTSAVGSGYVVAMNRPGGAGVIYYTTDGNDPHIYYTPTVGATAASVAATAQTYAAPITINATTTIKARVLNAGVWSALNEATFSAGISQPAVRITEIMYNPPGGNAYEFIELQNTGVTAVDLGAWYLEGVDYYFPLGTMLNAGDRLLVANNNGQSGLFAARYPGVSVFGWYGGSLDNGGQRLALKDAIGRTVVSVDYEDKNGWSTLADGGGYSLEIIDPNGNPDSPWNWKASNAVKGTPGAANSPKAATALSLHEVLADNQGVVLVGGVVTDYIELKNTGGAPLDLQGWTVVTPDQSFVFPTSLILQPGEFHVLAAALRNNAGSVRILTPAGVLGDVVEYGNQAANFAIGRVSGAWVLTAPTVAAENVAVLLPPAAGNLVINEWLSNPLPGGADWIELYNQHNTLPVALQGLYFQTDSQLHRYAALSFVEPHGHLQLFADEKPGANQLDFKLPATGTALGILEASGLSVDTVAAVDFGVLAPGVTRGRTTDGAAGFTTFTGTASPGLANYVGGAWTGPVLNEVLARNVTSAQAPWTAFADWMELTNPTGSAFDLSGMKLGTSPDASAPTTWTFPAGTTISANGQLALWCDAGQLATTDALIVNGSDGNTRLALGDASGALYLFNPAGQLVSQMEWGFQIPDKSIGVSGGAWKLLAGPTRGLANAAAQALGAVTQLRFNEWMAQPVLGGDWFELYNLDANPVAMAGLYLTDDPSELGRVKFTVPALSFIGGQGWVKWEADAAPEAGRNHVNFNLDGSAEYLRLSNNDAAVTAINAVSFGLQASGVSQGRVPDGSATIAAMPGSPTPGGKNVLLPGPGFSLQPVSQTVMTNASVNFTVAASGSAPLTLQWKFNGADLPGRTAATLTLTGVTAANDGAYTCVATNTAGSVSSTAAMLTVQYNFAQWAALKGLLGGNAAAGADPDGDGVSNLLEFLYNLNPQAAGDFAALPQFALEPPTGAPQFLTLTYRRNLRAVFTSLDFQLAPTLTAGWVGTAPSVTENLSADPVTGDPRVRVKFSIAPAETAKFLRLQIAQ